MPFTKHHCMLGLGSDSILPKEGGTAARLRHRFRKMCQISRHHPETNDCFYSFPVVMAERQRHLYEGGNFLIHPFSMCSLLWKTTMILINVAHMCISTFRLFYVIVPLKDIKPHFIDKILLALNFFCWVDIVVNFNTGYVIEKMTNIVFDRSKITWHYLSRWFLIDTLSSMPVALILLHWFPHKSRHLLIAHIMSLLRCARLHTVVVDMIVFMKMFTKSFIWHGCVWHSVVFLVTCHWCSCINYLAPLISLYWYGEVPEKYNRFLNMSGSSNIMNFSMTDRYRKSIFIALSAFFGSGFTMFKSSDQIESLLYTTVIMYSGTFIIYNFVFLMKIYVTRYSSIVRYHELMNQVEEYMRHKQFPLPLKKRVRAFYYDRYQERYFDENNVLHSLSEGLRDEITLHTCNRLVQKVALFQGVEPDVMGSILGCLQPEVYLPNESVMRTGEIGHCMYFIANGTVAVYSLKGAEVCHLEDGAHFGEVALLMKDSKRVSTVIAVEITHLYRLDWEDFQQYIMNNNLLFERVEALASQRMHETVIRDEEMRRERSAEPQRDSGSSYHRPSVVASDSAASAPSR